MTSHWTSNTVSSTGVQSPGERARPHLGEELKAYGSEGLRPPGPSSWVLTDSTARSRADSAKGLGAQLGPGIAAPVSSRRR